MSLETGIYAVILPDNLEEFKDKVLADKRLIPGYKFRKSSNLAEVSLAGLHDYLTDEASTEGQSLFLEAEIKPSLEQVIKDAVELSEEPIQVCFVWSGDGIKTGESLSLEVFLEALNADKLHYKCKYVINGIQE